MITSVRLLLLFILPIHTIGRSALRCSVTCSALAICFISLIAISSEAERGVLMLKIKKLQSDVETGSPEAAAQPKKHALLPWAAIGACLVLLAGLLLYAAGAFRFRTIEGLIDACTGRGGVYTAEMPFRYVAVNDRFAEYHMVKSVRSSDLVGYVGEKYAGDFHRVKGTRNLKYLILRDSGGGLSLWAFSSFIVTESDSLKETCFKTAHGADPSKTMVFTPYTYGDTAAVFYGMNGPDDIAGITAEPPTDTGSEESRALRREIGTRTVTDRAQIAVFYDILSRTVCKGTAGGRGYEDLPDRFSYSFSPPDPEGKRTWADRRKDGELMRAERWLTVKLTDGTVADQWKYDAIKGCFYETGGIAAEPLSEADVYTLNGILGIE